MFESALIDSPLLLLRALLDVVPESSSSWPGASSSIISLLSSIFLFISVLSSLLAVADDVCGLVTERPAAPVPALAGDTEFSSDSPPGCEEAAPSFLPPELLWPVPYLEADWVADVVNCSWLLGSTAEFDLACERPVIVVVCRAGPR